MQRRGCGDQRVLASLHENEKYRNLETDLIADQNSYCCLCVQDLHCLPFSPRRRGETLSFCLVKIRCASQADGSEQEIRSSLD